MISNVWIFPEILAGGMSEDDPKNQLLRLEEAWLTPIGPANDRIVADMISASLVIAREAAVPAGASETALHHETEPMEQLRQAANGGNADALYKLGSFYYSGRNGIAEDQNEAIRWWKRAIECGGEAAARAANQLGAHYSYRQFMPDYIEAAKYYEKAKELGGRHNLDSILERLASASDTPNIQRAAEKGDIAACSEMGTRCLSGLGVEQSATNAFGWFRRAAMDGNDACAWAYMGYMYETGQGADLKLSEAISCYRRAAELDPAYESNLEELKEKLSDG